MIAGTRFAYSLGFGRWGRLECALGKVWVLNGEILNATGLANDSFSMEVQLLLKLRNKCREGGIHHKDSISLEIQSL
jgi:hypothetical protein